MTKAIQFILAGAGWKAGAYTIGYQSCDDATAQAGQVGLGEVLDQCERVLPATGT